MKIPCIPHLFGAAALNNISDRRGCTLDGINDFLDS